MIKTTDRQTRQIRQTDGFFIGRVLLWNSFYHYNNCELPYLILFNAWSPFIGPFGSHQPDENVLWCSTSRSISGLDLHDTVVCILLKKMFLELGLANRRIIFLSFQLLRKYSKCSSVLHFSNIFLIFFAKTQCGFSCKSNLSFTSTSTD